MHHHGGSLRRLTNDPELVDAILRDPAGAALPSRWRALADLAIQLTLRGDEMQESRIAALRESGLTDAGIHDAVSITAYFNFVNRLAQGVNIPLEGTG